MFNGGFLNFIWTMLIIYFWFMIIWMFIGVDAVVEENRAARIDGLKAALAVLAVAGVLSLFFTGSIPTTAPGSKATEAAVA